MPCCFDVGGWRALSQHLLDRISGDEVNEQENQRHNQPNDRDGVQQALGEIAKQVLRSRLPVAGVAYSIPALLRGHYRQFQVIHCSSDVLQMMHHVPKIIVEDKLEPQRSRTVDGRSEEHTSELQSRGHLVCRLLLE